MDTRHRPESGGNTAARASGRRARGSSTAGASHSRDGGSPYGETPTRGQGTATIRQRATVRRDSGARQPGGTAVETTTPARDTARRDGAPGTGPKSARWRLARAARGRGSAAPAAEMERYGLPAVAARQDPPEGRRRGTAGGSATRLRDGGQRQDSGVRRRRGAQAADGRLPAGKCPWHKRDGGGRNGGPHESGARPTTGPQARRQLWEGGKRAGVGRGPTSGGGRPDDGTAAVQRPVAAPYGAATALRRVPVGGRTTAARRRSAPEAARREPHSPTSTAAAKRGSGGHGAPTLRRRPAAVRRGTARFGGALPELGPPRLAGAGKPAATWRRNAEGETSEPRCSAAGSTAATRRQPRLGSDDGTADGSNRGADGGTATAQWPAPAQHEDRTARGTTRSSGGRRGAAGRL